jgi:ABC-2 type transport system ATP-binding protein
MLEVRDLTALQRHPAVDRVSFTIRPGEIPATWGLTKRKSTTVKMLTGLIGAFPGRNRFHGENVVQDMKAFSAASAMSPKRLPYPHLTGREYLQLAGRLHGLRRNVLEPKWTNC